MLEWILIGVIALEALVIVIQYGTINGYNEALHYRNAQLKVARDEIEEARHEGAMQATREPRAFGRTEPKLDVKARRTGSHRLMPGSARRYTNYGRQS